MNNIENNRLIAEFMGEINSIEDKVSFTKNCSTDELKYHTSWDWLIPVVAKIRNYIGEWTDPYMLYEKAAIVLITVPYGVLENTYKAIIEFIKELIIKKNKKK
jgi:hypothetical protein